MSEKPHTKFNELSQAKKIEHIWEYYKLHILVGIVSILFLGWMLNHYIFNPPAKITVDVSVFGSYANSDELMKLEDILTDYVIEEGVNEAVMVESLPVNEDLDAATQQATVAKMAAKVQLGDFDIMIFGSRIYEDYLISHSLMPLNDLISKGEYEISDDKLLSGADIIAALVSDSSSELKDEDLTDEIKQYKDDRKNYLIDVSDNAGFRRMLPSDDKIYIGVYAKAKPIEEVAKALEYFIQEYK